jgi:hypothetical protein
MSDLTQKWTVNCNSLHQVNVEGCKTGQAIIKQAPAKKLDLKHIKCLLCTISHPKGESNKPLANEGACCNVFGEENGCLTGDVLEELGLTAKEKKLSWNEQLHLILVRNTRRTVRKSISSHT